MTPDPRADDLEDILVFLKCIAIAAVVIGVVALVIG